MTFVISAYVWYKCGGTNLEFVRWESITVNNQSLHTTRGLWRYCNLDELEGKQGTSVVSGGLALPCLISSIKGDETRQAESTTVYPSHSLPRSLMLLNFILILAPLLAFLPSASAHGYLSKVVIDSTPYTANVPGAKPTDSPVRQISDIGPVKGAQNPDLNCGLSAKLATMVVPANPGSVVEFYWDNHGSGNVSRRSWSFFFFQTSR
jgi:hypothetical protein